MNCNFNKHITKKMLNEYGGSEKKRTILLDDGYKYLLKFPDPVREDGRKVSYINNAISEYIGCKIAKSMGLPVQEVLLGEYTEDGKTKIACACRDLRNPGDTMYEIDRLELESLDSKNKTNFRGIEEIISRIDGLSHQEIKNFYYDMFILDAFIGNTDRHNGNWALLSNKDDKIRICPIYDCGSCLSPLYGDEELENLSAPSIALSVHSALLDDSGKRISYHEYLLNGENEEINQALKRILPHINMPEIYKIIEETPYISEIRKAFYKTLLSVRYEKELIPAFTHLMQRETCGIPLPSSSEYDYYAFYCKNLRQIQNIPEFTRTAVSIGDTVLDVIRVLPKYALCFLEAEIFGFSIQSNHKEIAKAIGVLKAAGCDFSLESREESADFEQEEH